MAKATRCAAVLAVVLMVGCVSSDFVPLGNQTFAPRPEEHLIEVFVGDDAPVIVHKSIEHAKPTNQIPAGARMIGRVDASGAQLASWSSVINEAKTKARVLGGDGLVIGSWGSPVTGYGAYGTVYHGKALSFGVIRWRN